MLCTTRTALCALARADVPFGQAPGEGARDGQEAALSLLKHTGALPGPPAPAALTLPASPFEPWHEAVSRSFVPLQSSPLQPGGWSGTLAARSLGTAQLSRVAGDGAVVRRTPATIHRADPAYLKLGVQVRGCCVVEQDEREAALVPGDLVLYDTSRPYQLAFDTAFEMLVIMFPRERLHLPGGRLSDVTARRVSGRRGVGAAVRPFLSALADQLSADDVEPSATLSTAVLDLLAAALAEQLDCTSAVGEDAQRHALFLRVLSFVDARLDDPELTVAGIAAAHHVSVRYLQKLFEDEGRTVTEWVRRRRLERAGRDLADLAGAEWSISAVGARWGMGNPAAFSRAFRQEFGVTPSEYRRQHARSGQLPDELPCGLPGHQS